MSDKQLAKQLVVLVQVLGLALARLAKTKKQRRDLVEFIAVAGRYHANLFGPGSGALVALLEMGLKIDDGDGPDSKDLLAAMLRSDLQGAEQADEPLADGDVVQALLNRAKASDPPARPARKRTPRKPPKG